MRLFEVQAKNNFQGGWRKIQINPSAIGHVSFPDFTDCSAPKQKYVRLGLGSSAEYIIKLEDWKKIVVKANIDIEVI